jgi:hypothetical protein
MDNEKKEELRKFMKFLSNVNLKYKQHEAQAKREVANYIFENMNNLSNFSIDEINYILTKNGFKQQKQQQNKENINFNLSL